MERRMINSGPGLTFAGLIRGLPSGIGYFEPGHYCLLLVDGRQQNSRGMFLDEMAKVFEDLGCKVAYNLDGGHCSFMEMNGKVVNDPYKPEHEIEDGIFITEGSL